RRRPRHPVRYRPGRLQDDRPAGHAKLAAAHREQLDRAARHLVQDLQAAVAVVADEAGTGAGAVHRHPGPVERETGVVEGAARGGRVDDADLTAVAADTQPAGQVGQTADVELVGHPDRTVRDVEPLRTVDREDVVAVGAAG